MKLNPNRPIKEKARGAVRDAIKRGHINVPHMCERCGVSGLTTKDGRRALHAHHSDYRKPLDVEWLCPKCHRKETKLPDKIGGKAMGEKNGASRLTLAIAKEVIRLHSEGVSISKISRDMGVAYTTARDICNRKTWIAAREAGQ